MNEQTREMLIDAAKYAQLIPSEDFVPALRQIAVIFKNESTKRLADLSGKINAVNEAHDVLAKMIP